MLTIFNIHYPIDEAYNMSLGWESNIGTMILLDED
jgi:hypothetical protein